MRRVVVTTAVTAAGVVLLLSLKPHTGAGGAATRPISSDAGPQPTTAATSAAPSTPGSTTSPTSPTSPATTGTATTRTVTGDAADTRYGPVQVKVTLAGTRITRIDVVRYPSESGRDRSINSYALPQLNQEAIAAQSAEIDVVSGASYTSDGYTRSLQSALDKARG